VGHAFLYLVDNSHRLVSSTTTPQLRPLHKYCQICGGQDFVPALKTDDIHWANILLIPLQSVWRV